MVFASPHLLQFCPRLKKITINHFSLLLFFAEGIIRMSSKRKGNFWTVKAIGKKYFKRHGKRENHVLKESFEKYHNHWSLKIVRWETPPRNLCRIVECFWVLQLGQKKRKGVRVRPGSPAALPSASLPKAWENTSPSSAGCSLLLPAPSLDLGCWKPHLCLLPLLPVYGHIVQICPNPFGAWLLPRTAHSRNSVSITYKSSSGIVGFGE